MTDEERQRILVRVRQRLAEAGLDDPGDDFLERVLDELLSLTDDVTWSDDDRR